MRMLKACLLALALSLPGVALAHGSHQHQSVSPAQAQDIARHVATKLTEADRGMGFGILDQSWRDIPADKISISRSGPGYVVVALEHEAEQRTLYVLLSETGEVYDANFSGQFKGIP